VETVGGLVGRRVRELAAIEARLTVAVGAAVRQLLRQVSARVPVTAVAASGSLTAASGAGFLSSTSLFTIGEAHGWWADAVDVHVRQEVYRAWSRGFFTTRDGELLFSSLQAADDYLGRVKDRLVYGAAGPVLPDRAFEVARVSISDELARGSSLSTVSARLASDFGWDVDGRFWRGRYDELTVRLDGLLDPVGPPGSVERLAAQYSDPAVNRLQALRAEAARNIDRVKSEWEVRAERIARTECLPADAKVTSGRVTAAYRRLYDGEWVTVRLGSGHELSGTPNHPMLTQRGWVGLGELTEHDRVLHHRGQVQGTGAPGDEDVEAPPASIGELFDALAAVGVVERRRAGEPDFHGDGMDGDVDVALPDGVLLVGDFAAVNEGAVDGLLEGSDLRDVAFDAFCAPFPRGGAVDEPHGLARGAQPDSGLPEDAGDDALGYAELAAKRLQRPSRLVLLDDGVGWEVCAEAGVVAALEAGEGGGLAGTTGDAADVEDVLDLPLGEAGGGSYGRGALAGEVALDDVVSVEVGHFTGHVYNLSTVDGYFTTGTYYTGNTTAAYNAGTLEALHVEGAGVKVWVATNDARTRDEHLQAHLQCVPLDDEFDVGGTRMAMPGDPSAPAELVVNCRCTLVGADDCAQAAELYGFAGVEDEAARRGMELPEAEAFTDPNDEPWTVSLQLSGKLREAAVSAMERVAARFPQLARDVWVGPGDADHPANRIANGWVERDDPHSVNISVSQAKMHPDWLAQMRKDQKDRGLLPGVPDVYDGWEEIVTHELGHIAHNKVGIGVFKDQVEAELRGSHGIDLDLSGEFFHITDVVQLMELQELRAALGVYATTKTAEFLADAFCDGMLSPSPTVYGLAVLSVVRRLLR
jgi:hypothetical protein